MTKQREAVLEVIRSDFCHHTAEEIFVLAKEKLPGISRATVYNNLKALEGLKLIRRITGGGLADRYDSAFKPHGHLLCEVCGRVWDFYIDGIDGMITDAIENTFTSYELKVRHVCRECKNLKMSEDA